MEYNLALQSISSKTTQASLDKIQNEATRFVSGGMRSTPTAACEINANIQPLKFRRNAAVINMVERYKREDINHPNRILTENWKPIDRIQQKSILSVATELENEYKMPDNRETSDNIPRKFPPHNQLLKPSIKTELHEVVTKKDSDPVSLMTISQRTIDSYPENLWIHVYTDGSATNGMSNAGYGAKIMFPDDDQMELSNSCGSLCSNYDAESVAIEESIRSLDQVFSENPNKITNTVIFSDSKSVLQALESNSTESQTIQSLSVIISSFLSTHSTNLTLQWIPGHVNIPGNERADLLAKRGAQLDQPTRPVPYNTAKSIVQQKIQTEWMKEWKEGKLGGPCTHTCPNQTSKTLSTI